MSTFAISPWQISREADRRFALLMRTLLGVYLIAGIAIPLIQLAVPEKPEEEPRYVTLLPPQPPKPQVKPPPVPPTPQPKTPPKKVQAKPAPAPKPELTQEQKVQLAREKAQQKMQALSNQLNDLRDRRITAVDSTRALSSADASKSDSKVSDFSAAAAKNSSGIATHAPSARRGDTQLGQRETTSISSPVGFGRDASKAASNGSASGPSGRSGNQIQQTFERAHGSFNAIFMRAMRENGNISPGRLLVTLTLAPDGSVTDVKVTSNTIGDQTIADKIVARIKLLNFGAWPTSQVYPNYPIVFQPS